MKEFDIQFNANGMQDELSQFKDIQSELFVNNKSNFQGEFNKENDKNWIDTLNQLNKEFKGISGYKTQEQLKAEKEKELAEKGTKYKILGMNPFVAIGFSFAVIIIGSIALTKIKAV